MRRTSVSLPRNVAYDPHEKAARYSTKGARNSAAGKLENLKTAWMTQSQRSRYLKTGGILLFVIFLFYALSPSGTYVVKEGRYQQSLSRMFDSLMVLSCESRRRRWSNGRPVVRNNEVLEVQRQVKAPYPICPHDRCRKYWLPNPRLQI
jgi:hypothetical protein